MLELNRIHCGDNCDLLGKMPRESVDLVVTSPPYDDLRTYGGHSWDFFGVAWHLKRVLKPGGVIVQVGLGGSFTLPINIVVNREFDLRGTFRFHEEFGLAAKLIGERRVDVRPLISATLPFQSAIDAFKLASDRTKAMKAQLDFPS